MLVDEFEEKMQKGRVQGNELFFLILRKWIRKWHNIPQLKQALKLDKFSSERNKK